MHRPRTRRFRKTRHGHEYWCTYLDTILFTFNNRNLKNGTNVTPVLGVGLDSGALERLVLHKPVQKHSKLLEFTGHMVIRTRISFTFFIFQHFHRFPILPVEDLPRKAGVSNVYQFQVPVQIGNGLQRWIGENPS